MSKNVIKEELESENEGLEQDFVQNDNRATEQVFIEGMPINHNEPIVQVDIKEEPPFAEENSTIDTSFVSTLKKVLNNHLSAIVDESFDNKYEMVKTGSQEFVNTLGIEEYKGENLSQCLTHIRHLLFLVSLH